MIDFNLYNSTNFESFNMYKENTFVPQENNFFNDFNNFNNIFESKLPSLLNEDNEEDQRSALFRNEVVPEENLFIAKDDNDKADAVYLATEMLPEEKTEEHMKINEEAVAKIFDVTKEKKAIKKSVPLYPRIDDYKIYVRAKINKYFIERLNTLIEASELPKELKKIIHAPNYKKFTIIVKCSSTYDDLSKTMSTILVKGHETQKNQRQNLENIQAIFNYSVNHQNQSVQKIVELLLKTYEQIIEEFYCSSKFIELYNDETAKFYDEEFRKQKKFSLLEKNGLIRLFKGGKGKKEENEKMMGRKRTIKRDEP